MWNLEYKAPRGFSCAGRSVAIVRFDVEGMWPRQVSQTGDGNLAGFVVKQGSPPSPPTHTHVRTAAGLEGNSMFMSVARDGVTPSEGSSAPNEGICVNSCCEKSRFENILMQEWKERLVESMTCADFEK